MNYTEYYKLLKPLEEEQYDINIHNANSDMIDFELNRLKEKDTEIQQNIAVKSLLWNDKYTKEEVDAKIAGIEIPTKISDLENDSGLGSITGIKGSNEAEYRHTGDINISADDIGALRITELHGTDDHVLNLDAITDFGMYRISNDGIMWVKYNNGDSQIDCKYMDLFVGGSDRFKYQVVFPLDYYKKFRIRFITISEAGNTEFSAWSEIATLKELLDYIDARCVKNTQILNTQEQIDANTSNQNIAGALAVKQIKHDLEQQIIAAVSGVTGVKGNAESAYRTGNVNVTPANIGAVNKAGDTMNGIYIYEKGSAIAFKGKYHTSNLISFIDDSGSTDSYGNGIRIGCDGFVLVASGESGNLFSNIGGATEETYIASDGRTRIMPGCQNGHIDDSRDTVFEKDGGAHTPYTGARTKKTMVNGLMSNAVAGRSQLMGDGLWFAHLYSSRCQGWIRSVSIGSSISEIEIAGGNSGGINERIYARQYDSSGKVAHEVTLLGYNGETSFLKYYYHGSFSPNTTNEVSFNTDKLYSFYMAEVSVSAASAGKVGTLSQGIIAVSDRYTPVVYINQGDSGSKISIQEESKKIIISTPSSHRAIIHIYEISNL